MDHYILEVSVEGAGWEVAVNQVVLQNPRHGVLFTGCRGTVDVSRLVVPGRNQLSVLINPLAEDDKPYSEDYPFKNECDRLAFSLVQQCEDGRRVVLCEFEWQSRRYDPVEDLLHYDCCMVTRRFDIPTEDAQAVSLLPRCEQLVINDQLRAEVYEVLKGVAEDLAAGRYDTLQSLRSLIDDQAGFDRYKAWIESELVRLFGSLDAVRWNSVEEQYLELEPHGQGRVVVPFLDIQSSALECCGRSYYPSTDSPWLYANVNDDSAEMDAAWERWLDMPRFRIGPLYLGRIDGAWKIIYDLGEGQC